jgi:D-amino peptidase
MAYVFTDLEGVAGVDDWDPRLRDDASHARGVADRLEMQRLLTGEVNAAVAGLLEAGVEDVLVNDAHGAGRTILVEDLHPGAQIARGTVRPYWLLGVSRRCDALFQVGMHAMAGTASACLAHTQSRGYIYKLNDRPFGEMEQAALLAGELGIPWVFTSGDAYACREAEDWIPGMVSAPVKTGLSLTCAVHLAPADARALIRSQIQEAVGAAEHLSPLTVDGPVVMDVVREEPWPASIREGAERVDAFTIRYRGDSFWSVFHQHAYGRPDLPLPD